MNEATRALFADHNLRCTDQRLALYEALASTTSHPTADELHRMVSHPDQPVSRATVYNTLDAFVDAGLCRRMPTANGCCRYDADMSDHLHVRFRDTGEVMDVPGELGDRLVQGLAPDVLDEISRVLGVDLDGVSIQLLARRGSVEG